jgi:hypothetical protein
MRRLMDVTTALRFRLEDLINIQGRVFTLTSRLYRRLGYFEGFVGVERRDKRGGKRKQASEG